MQPIAFAATLAALVCSQFAAAAELRAVNVTNLRGTYLLTITDQAVTLQTIEIVNDSPTPPPPPPPPPIDLTARAKAFATAAGQATADPQRERTAQQLAAFYGALAGKITNGQVTGPALISAAAKMGADTILGSQAAAWSAFAKSLSGEFNRLAQEGAKDEAYASLFLDASRGLAASVPAADGQPIEADAINLDVILKLLDLILEILKRFQPK